MSSRALVRPALSGLLLSTLAVVSSPLAAPPAQASSIYHCSGWEGCEAAGYSTSGYINAHNKMYWQMFSGHNCTNYVAYRLVQAGMPNVRPWSGGGNANNWGHQMKNITDQTPTVGSVAWWDSGAAGMSASGHVAYVEKVISPTKIVVSEDAWSGTFHWRTIVKDGTSWPSGFIHFIDQKKLEMKNPPRIDGTPQVGQPMRAYTGLWSQQATYTFQWLADGVAIPGATRATYVPTAAVVGKTLSARVTAKKNGYADGTAVSAKSTAVKEGVLSNTQAPTVAGDPMVDDVLTVTRGAWSPTPASALVRWKVNGKFISATGPSLKVAPAYVGKTITAVETAKLDGYTKTTSAPSNGVGPVIAGVVEVAAPATGTGLARKGSTLQIVGAQPTTSGTTTAITWLRDGVRIPGATGTTYRLVGDDVGAKVTATVAVTRAGWQPYQQTVAFGGPVTTPTVLKGRSVGKSGAAKVYVRVGGAAKKKTTGKVRVQIGKHQATGELVNGKVTVWVRGLTAGKRFVKVSYLGDGIAEPDKMTMWVTVGR